MDFTPRDITLITGQKAIIGYQLDLPAYQEIKHNKLIAEIKDPIIFGRINKEEEYKQAIRNIVKKLVTKENAFVIGTIMLYIQNSKHKIKKEAPIQFLCKGNRVEFATKTGLKAVEYNYYMAQQVMSHTRHKVADIKVPDKYNIELIGIKDKQIVISDTYQGAIHYMDYVVGEGYYFLSNRTESKKVKGTGKYLTFEIAETPNCQFTHGLFVKNTLSGQIVGFYVGNLMREAPGIFDLIKDKGNAQLTFTAYVRDNQVAVASVDDNAITLHYVPKLKMIRFHAEADGYEATAYAMAHIDKTLELDETKCI